jgi:hypothetical protein
MTRIFLIMLAAASLIAPVRASAQDMEPRAYSASPVGANFIVIGYSHSAGAVVFDPSLPVSDVHADVDGVAIGLGHTFGLFGKLALASAALPYALADVTGKVGENAAEVHRSGLADTRLRFSVNLRGNDAMPARQFVAAKPRTVVGVSLSVTAPASQYSGTKLINLGTNRWSFKPEVGVAAPRGRWDFDAYLGVIAYTANSDFYPGGVERTQNPVVTVQGHVSYTIRPRAWIAGDWTWYHGGSAQSEGGNPTTALNNARGGVTLSMPVKKRYSLKVAYGSGIVARTGTNFRTISVGWQALWLSPRWAGR